LVGKAGIATINHVSVIASSCWVMCSIASGGVNGIIISIINEIAIVEVALEVALLMVSSLVVGS